LAFYIGKSVGFTVAGDKIAVRYSCSDTQRHNAKINALKRFHGNAFNTDYTADSDIAGQQYDPFALVLHATYWHLRIWRWLLDLTETSCTPAILAAL